MKTQTWYSGPTSHAPSLTEPALFCHLHLWLSNTCAVLSDYISLRSINFIFTRVSGGLEHYSAKCIISSSISLLSLKPAYVQCWRVEPTEFSQLENQHGWKPENIIQLSLTFLLSVHLVKKNGCTKKLCAFRKLVFEY